MFNRLRREGGSIVKEIISLVYYMRGAVSYSEMMNMTYAERELVREFIEDRLESQKKTPNPVY